MQETGIKVRFVVADFLLDNQFHYTYRNDEVFQGLTTHDGSPGMILGRSFIPWEDFIEFG
jgi:hypothetical protein